MINFIALICFLLAVRLFGFFIFEKIRLSMKKESDKKFPKVIINFDDLYTKPRPDN